MHITLHSTLEIACRFVRNEISLKFDISNISHICSYKVIKLSKNVRISWCDVQCCFIVLAVHDDVVSMSSLVLLTLLPAPSG